MCTRNCYLKDTRPLKMNAPTHWLPFYSQMLKMQQKLTTEIDPTYRNIFWTEKKKSLKTQEVSHHMLAVTPPSMGFVFAIQ